MAEILAVRLTPRGGRDAIDGWALDADGRAYLKVRVASPPVDGAANAALLAFLAKTLKLPRSAVRLASARLPGSSGSSSTASGPRTSSASSVRAPEAQPRQIIS